MMSLPYIDEKMKNKDEVIILTENNLEETMKTFLSKVNFKEEKKEIFIRNAPFSFPNLYGKFIFWHW